jgi:dTDP-6-deoxy-L-talose 4-dehydrogenase (NAD+)
MIQHGLASLTVSGTCFEYGLQGGCLSEDTPAIPSTSYGVAKDSLRRFLETIRSHHPFRLLWIRLFYLYGEGQNKSALIPQLDSAIGRGENEFNMSGGEQLRDYLPVEDAARRLVTLALNPSCDGIVNICRGAPISVRRLVEEHIARRNASIHLNLGHYPYPQYEPMAFWGDGSKQAQHLPKTSTSSKNQQSMREA